MELHSFMVSFQGGSQLLDALNAEQATILAQAEQIKYGRDYRVIQVWEYDDKANDWERCEDAIKNFGQRFASW